MNIDGFACVIPTLVVLVLAILSKRTIEPLVGGTVVGLAMLAPSELLTNFTDVILTVMQDETIGWVIMVCGLMGGLIALLARIGGASAFGRLASRRVRTRASALLATWLLGLAVFIDDYLNALAISSSMKRLTDRFRVSRGVGGSGEALPAGEMLAGLRGRLHRGAVLNFLLPILALVGFTWYLGADILKGVTVALALTLVLVAVQRLLSVTELFDTILEGFKSMLLPLGTVVAGFMLKEVNDDLGLAPYVIGVVQPLMTPEFLPLVTFLTIALIAFASGSFWGIIVVAMPIVIPLAEAVNADLSLVIGALISASAFGSHTCFYGDSTVLSAHGSGCGAIDHALTQLPYALLAAGGASVAFVIAGYALG